MKHFFPAVLLLAIACGRAPAPGAPVEYSPPDKSFTARLPSNWKADEAPGETRKAAFFGPPDGPRPFAQMMGVYFHAAADPAAEARAYIAANGGAAPARDGALESEVRSVAKSPEGGEQTVVTRTIAVPAAGGFYTLVHVYPADAPASASFEELRATFKPARPQ